MRYVYVEKGKRDAPNEKEVTSFPARMKDNPYEAFMSKNGALLQRYRAHLHRYEVFFAEISDNLNHYFILG